MDKPGDFIDGQKWLEPVETALGAVADTLLNKKRPFMQKVRNFLHGTWLGHPIHPVITDVPIGAWTVAAIFDTYELTTGDEILNRGADLAVGIGLLGAVGAAATGLTDWSDTYEKPRRVGTMHALVNLTATASTSPPGGNAGMVAGAPASPAVSVVTFAWPSARGLAATSFTTNGSA